MRVYLTCPVAVMNSPRYDNALEVVHDWVAEQTGGLGTVNGVRGLYSNAVDWRMNWVSLLKQCDTLVFVRDLDGWVGKGTWAEINYARNAGYAVFCCTDDGTLVSFRDCGLAERQPDDYTRHARIVTQAEADRGRACVTLDRAACEALHSVLLVIRESHGLPDTAVGVLQRLESALAETGGANG